VTPGRGPAATLPRGYRPAFPITPSRGKTSRERLEIDWDYPVIEAKQGADTAVRGPLTYAGALAAIADSDPRPLLVLRDCTVCKGGDHAMLSHTQQNDRTYLLSRWFHCVKLPTDVTSRSHVLCALFQDRGKSHLFLCNADGKNRVDLSGNQNPRRLRDAMIATLRSAYPDNVAGRTRELLRVLDEFDRIDARLLRVDAAFNRELERNGARTSRAKKLAMQLKEIVAERNELLEREHRLREATPAGS